MAVCRNWAFDAAHEIALMQIRDDARLPASDMEGVIKRHCPFQQDTAYAPVSINHNLERAVIEAAIEYFEFGCADNNELERSVRALIAAREDR